MTYYVETIDSVYEFEEDGEGFEIKYMTPTNGSPEGLALKLDSANKMFNMDNVIAWGEQGTEVDGYKKE